MKRDKMFLLVGIFLVTIILSTIHPGYREGMSHHDEKERLKGEQHGAFLIEKDIKHREKTMQNSNQYNNDKQYNEWNEDINISGDDEENIYGPGGEEWPKHHHKPHNKPHHKPHNLSLIHI